MLIYIYTLAELEKKYGKDLTIRYDIENDDDLHYAKLKGETLLVRDVIFPLMGKVIEVGKDYLDEAYFDRTHGRLIPAWACERLPDQEI